LANPVKDGVEKFVGIDAFDVFEQKKARKRASALKNKFAILI